METEEGGRGGCEGGQEGSNYQETHCNLQLPATTTLRHIHNTQCHTHQQQQGYREEHDTPCGVRNENLGVLGGFGVAPATGLLYNHRGLRMVFGHLECITGCDVYSISSRCQFRSGFQLVLEGQSSLPKGFQGVFFPLGGLKNESSNTAPFPLVKARHTNHLQTRITMEPFAL